MAANTATEKGASEVLPESPAEQMKGQMLMLKKAHFGEHAHLNATDLMEANRIGGLPLNEQLSAYNEWATQLAAEVRKELLEQIASSTRSQLELSAKLDASEKARKLNHFEAVKWKNLAHVDDLTREALNKKAMFEELHDKIAEIEAGHKFGFREGQWTHLSVLFLDLDHFKKINDTLGHPVGDEALKVFYTLIRKNVRKEDIVSRYGGEEFIVVMKNADAKVAAKSAEKIRAAVEENLRDRLMELCPDKKDEVMMQDGTVSIGIESFGKDSEETIDPETLVKRADEALYHSKNSGRNKVTAYPPSEKATNTEKN